MWTDAFLTSGSGPHKIPLKYSILVYTAAGWERDTNLGCTCHRRPEAPAPARRNRLYLYNILLLLFTCPRWFKIKMLLRRRRRGVSGTRPLRSLQLITYTVKERDSYYRSHNFPNFNKTSSRMYYNL